MVLDLMLLGLGIALEPFPIMLLLGFWLAGKSIYLLVSSL
jgi:hypothetical protein